ncbi:MAG TPA: hypothetical protein VNH64_03925, partial [Parvularculaceae bacterium]|nr:hypothetical protein [Parvularculaceae bacterium]
MASTIKRIAGRGLMRLATAALGLALIAAPAYAGPISLEQTYTSGIANGWVRVERWNDGATGFTQEAFPPDGRGDQSGQRKTFFGNNGTPRSSKFLMYYAPGWDVNSNPAPVLLVQGANQDADLAWANPNEAGSYGCGRRTCPTSSLMQLPSGSGYKVFATNFPHKNGDSYFWAEQIADAIAIVKSRTGAPAVDVIAWSKATTSARMYVSSIRQSWGTSYRGDVRSLVLLGAANNGIDLSFRHGWSYSLMVYPECGGAIDGPVPNDMLVCFGVWTNGSQWTYGSAYFPGSKQLLKRWDSVYPLGTADQDWYTTYYGGFGFYTHSPGIAAYLGESLIDLVRNSPTPA